MRFMMFMIPEVYQGEGTRREKLRNFAPDAEAISKMMKYNEELARAGVLLSLEGLHPSSAGARVTFASGKPQVTDGPFSESKEVVGGYWLINVKSREEAIEWAKRVPAERGDTIEVRQIFELSEFPPDAQKAAESSVVEQTLEKRKSGR